MINDVNILGEWFKNNSLIANPSKFQLMFLGHKIDLDIEIEILNTKIKNQKEIELLGIIIDNKLTFTAHIDKACKKANNKLNSIIRLRSFLTEKQTRLLTNAHVISHILYCSIIWMFCNKTNRDKLESLQKRMLKTITKKDISLKELIIKENSYSFHQMHLQNLMLEIYKIFNKESADLLIDDTFLQKTNPYSLRNNSLLKIPIVKSTTYGTNSIIFKGSIIWNKLPQKINKTCRSEKTFRVTCIFELISLRREVSLP